MDSRSLLHTARRLAPLAQAYDLRLRQYGATAGGVYWRNEDGQRLRFEVLLDIIGPEEERLPLSLADLGCGYGAFFDFLAEQPQAANWQYRGYDISPGMIRMAERRIRDPRARFEQSLIATHLADFSFVSGTYNMKLDEPARDWQLYIEENLKDLWSKTRRGLAFNMLCTTTKNRKESDLFYADWRIFKDFCENQLSPDVTIRRDYPLAEWTMYVRR